jgi:hypothetical protein
MELETSRRQIKLDKELNELDHLVIDFARILNANKIDYVLVSGYISILFGRSRSSEDIDLIVKKISRKQFSDLWQALSEEGFECITTTNPKDAYDRYLMKRSAIRFSREGTFIPNMEFKFPKTGLDRWVVGHAKKVVLNGNAIKISPIELQISFKLFLGSEKDIEDARYLYKLFKETLDKSLLEYFLENLDKEDKFKKYLA